MLNVTTLSKQEAQRLYRLIEQAQKCLADALPLVNSIIPVNAPLPPSAPKKTRKPRAKRQTEPAGVGVDGKPVNDAGWAGQK